MERKKILVINDDEDLTVIVKLFLKPLDVDTIAAKDGASGIEKAKNIKPDLILLDQYLPDMTGNEILAKLLSFVRNYKIVMFSASHDTAFVEKALKAGAVDYISKPIRKELFLDKISKLLASAKLNNATQETKESGYIFGKSYQMTLLKEEIKDYLDVDANLLILGGTGTGKTEIANYVHKQSKRAKKEFVVVNCPAIPQTLFESELFGHEKGAFTGATEKKIGKFEIAQGGTILLDEISEIPVEIQAKLLEVIQNKVVKRIGGHKKIQLDLRIICATNRDPVRLINLNRLRDDLFYRINTISLFLSPLRERREDIPLIADYFLKFYSNLYKKDIPLLSANLMHELQHSSWPGNIRELKSFIERSVVQHKTGELDFKSDLKARAKEKEENKLEKLKNDFLFSKFQSAWEANLGNISKTSQSLGVSRPTVYKWLKKLNAEQ